MYTFSYWKNPDAPVTVTESLTIQLTLTSYDEPVSHFFGSQKLQILLSNSTVLSKTINHVSIKGFDYSTVDGPANNAIVPLEFNTVMFSLVVMAISTRVVKSSFNKTE